MLSVVWRFGDPVNHGARSTAFATSAHATAPLRLAGMSRTMLRYKAIARGALYVDVSEAFTTQTCSDCGSIGGPKGTKGLEIREWRCDCGAVHDRDVNAARNILRLGHEALAEGSSLLSVS